MKKYPPLVGAMRIFVLLGLLAATLPVAFAQTFDPTSGGRNYVIAFPDTTTNTADARYPNNSFEDHCYIYIYSAVSNSCSITGGGLSSTFTDFPAHQFVVVDLMARVNGAAFPIVDKQGQVQKNTFTLSAREPIIVYCMMITRYGSEAWTPLAVENWGKEYYAATTAAEVAHNVTPKGSALLQKNIMAPSEILVTAAFDNTQLTIIPNCPLWLRPNVNNVVLNAGETYLVQSYVDTLSQDLGSPQPDLGGSRIVATKPIGVITGNTRAQASDSLPGVTQNSFKNMLMESLNPVERWGNQFVYIPTQDGLNVIDTNVSKNGKRQYEHVRIYAQDTGVTHVWYSEGAKRIEVPPINTSDPSAPNFADVRLVPNQARVFYTDKPAQAVMHSGPVDIVDSVRSSGQTYDKTYHAWAPYMVTIVPRQQWSNFAPFYAPTLPTGMWHRINVVTDTAHRKEIYTETGGRFSLPNTIPGTDLCWGTAAVNPGIDHWLEGKNGARFYACLYGELQGSESSTIGSPPHYTETIAQSYGYPLESRHALIDYSKDNTSFGSMDACGVLDLTFALLDTAAGIRSVALDTGSSNTRILSISPQPISGAREISITLGAIDSSKNAKASVLLTDSSGLVRRIPYNYTAEVVRFKFDTVDFGFVAVGAQHTLYDSLTVARNLPDVTVYSMKILPDTNGAGIFRIPSYAVPFSIKEGQGIKVQLDVQPTAPGRHYCDTLVFTLDCREYRVLLKAATAPVMGVKQVAETGYSLSEITPNPASDVAVMRFTLAHPGQVRIEIFDELGEELVPPTVTEMEEGEHQTPLKIKTLPNGRYYCRITSGDWTASSQFVLQR